MTIRLDALLRCIAAALDAVEIDLLGASTNHGKRIATLCIAMGRHLGMKDSALLSLSSCALLHDSALTEYILSERPGKEQALNLRLHCRLGQRNAEALPCPGDCTDISGYVLYHHEQADGKGPFGKKEGEFPLGAAIIAIADMLDVQTHLQRLPLEDLPALRLRIEAERGTRYTGPAADAMLAVLDEEMLLSLRDENIHQTVTAATPPWVLAVQDRGMMDIADMVARIIDYKSTFTRKHSVQIANKAYWMSGVYGFEPEKRAQVYLAASLHDLGKLYMPTEILEKSGKLDDEEFRVVQSHVRWTQELLRGVQGMETICDWASHHHEKLDGSGYSDGLDRDELDFVSRMIACLDIYQAVTEERPYHPVRSHEEGMAILRAMASDGKIDRAIVADLDREMAPFPGGDVPHP